MLAVGEGVGAASTPALFQHLKKKISTNDVWKQFVFEADHLGLILSLQNQHENVLFNAFCLCVCPGRL